MATVIDANEGLPPRKRRKDEADIDITPMIDIVFLLLAFFVIVSKMDPAAAVKMPKARYGESVPDGSCVFMVVAETNKESPLVYLGKAKTEGEELKGAPEDISDKITEYVAKELKSSADKTTIMIKAERKVKSRHVAMVKDAVSKVINEDGGSGEDSIYKMYVGIEEE